MKYLVYTASLAVLALLSAEANAAVITRAFNISGTFDPGAPIQQLGGTFTLTWDTAVNATDSTSGLTISNFSFLNASQVGYDYQASNGQLIFGGLINTVNSLNGNTKDFAALINNATGASPSLAALVYVDNTTNIYSTNNRSLQVDDVSSVPEPATWGMMIGGFGMMGAAMRRHRKVAVSFS